MRNVLGLALTLVAAGYVYGAVALRARRLAERRAAGIADDAEPASQMYAFGAIMRPVLLFMLAYLGVKAALVYHWLDGARYLSLFDLGAFLAALAAYGCWIAVKTRYAPVAFFRPAVAANDAGDAGGPDRRAAA